MVVATETPEIESTFALIEFAKIAVEFRVVFPITIDVEFIETFPAAVFMIMEVALIDKLPVGVEITIERELAIRFEVLAIPKSRETGTMLFA